MDCKMTVYEDRRPEKIEKGGRTYYLIDEERIEEYLGCYNEYMDEYWKAIGDARKAMESGDAERRMEEDARASRLYVAAHECEIVMRHFFGMKLRYDFMSGEATADDSNQRWEV